MIYKLKIKKKVSLFPYFVVLYNNEKKGTSQPKTKKNLKPK